MMAPPKDPIPPHVPTWPVVNPQRNVMPCLKCGKFVSNPEGMCYYCKFGDEVLEDDDK